MGREIKRVPLDFAWPLDEIWSGYLLSEQVEPPEGEGWQVWETVSEGAPVSPVFTTGEDLVDYLVDKGDVWSQKRRADGEEDPPPSRAAAKYFVFEAGWAPSMAMILKTESKSPIKSVEEATAVLLKEASRYLVYGVTSEQARAEGSLDCECCDRSLHCLLEPGHAGKCRERWHTP